MPTKTATTPHSFTFTTTTSSQVPKKRCPTRRHSGQKSVLNRGKIPFLLQRMIKNAYLYFSQYCNNPYSATSAATHVGRKVVSRISKQDLGGKVHATKRKGRKAAQVDEFDKSIIRRIVHEYYRRNEPPTVRKLLATVKERFTENGTCTFPYGTTTLLKILHHLGFKYMKRPGTNLHLLFERSDIMDWRAHYLQKIRQYRAENRTIVYLDETWFNSYGAFDKVWVDTTIQENPRRPGPGSSETLGLKFSSGKGQRLIIVNAIERDGLVNNSLLIFRSGKRVSPADYHNEMNSQNFEKWFRTQLLPNLKPMSVIVMDNAPYHSRRLISLPTRGRRDDVIEFLQNVGFFQFLEQRGLPHNPEDMTMTKIFALCKEFRSHFNVYAVDQMTEDHGHTILRLPPYHCIFNPIEMVWSYQKHIVKSNSTARTVQQAEEICKSAFSQLPDSGAAGYFDRVEEVEQQFWNKTALPVQHPPVIIPVYDDDADDIVAVDSADEDEDLSYEESESVQEDNVSDADDISDSDESSDEY